MDEIYVTYVDDEHVDNHDYDDNTDDDHDNNNDLYARAYIIYTYIQSHFFGFFWGCFRICFGFVLSLPYVDGLVLGVDNLKQMEENVEMFKSASLTEDQRNEISQAFSIDNVPEQLLDPAQWPKK